MKLWRTMTVSVALAASCALTACGASGDEDGAASPAPSSTASTSAAASPSATTAVAEPTITDSAAPSVDSNADSSVAPLPSAPAAPEVDARSPDEVVAGAGERGQGYLGALRSAGIPAAGMDAQEILYAEGVCQAHANGMSRSDMLREFDGVGQMYATILPMSAAQIAEIYVATAESSYC